ncbi:hypothetical protein BJP36_26990 [Moorena producens JHB]|uniref:Uncharacterized protein n=1 Tax=Moorena producens (strain JHB) TaxID=1454205 RepID=A0A1D9G5W2_MOOP1|nr:hypothetical protein [Moorena producens]AOY83018.2 hypothetical protein BJP36_26990 [Moorena producens JHB]
MTLALSRYANGHALRAIAFPDLEAMIIQVVFAHSPTMDLTALIAKVKARYVTACQQLVNLLAEILESKAAKAFGHER